MCRLGLSCVRRIVLTLLTLAVLLPSSAFARTSFLCGMDGKVRQACCCPSKQKKHEAPPASTIRASCCCSITTIAPVTTPPATSEAKAAPVPPMVAIVTVPPAVPSQIQRVTVAPRSLAPPDPERSLFVRHCALLL